MNKLKFISLLNTEQEASEEIIELVQHSAGSLIPTPPLPTDSEPSEVYKGFVLKWTPVENRNNPTLTYIYRTSLLTICGCDLNNNYFHVK